MKSLRPTAVLCALGMTFCIAACVSQSGKQIASLFYNVGNDFFDLGKYDKAIEAYQNALQADPGMVKADYNLALTLVRMKRVDEAVVILKRLLADDQKNTTLMGALGWAYHEQGKDKDALDQYNAVLALSPADQNALYNSGIILWKLTRKDDALERFRQDLVYAPDDTDALFAAGSLLLSQDEPRESEDMLSRYVEKKPDDTDAWYLIAAGAERLLKYSRALEAYNKIVAIDPKQPNAWFGEARLLLTVVEDPEKGLDALDKALSAGFNDKVAVKALLASEQLLERERVEVELKEHDLLPSLEQPKAQPQATDQSKGQAQTSGQQNAQPQADEPKPKQ